MFIGMCIEIRSEKTNTIEIIHNTTINSLI